MPTPSRPHVHAVNVNPNGGVPKYLVNATTLTAEGVAGDRQNDRRHHGGPERAVCLLGVEVIETLRALGHPILPGSTGENLTLRGLDWAGLGVGDRLEIGGRGGAVLEVTAHAPPCKVIAGSFAGGDVRPLSPKLSPGQSRLYARVLVEGRVRVGDRLRRVAAGTATLDADAVA